MSDAGVDLASFDAGADPQLCVQCQDCRFERTVVGVLDAVYIRDTHTDGHTVHVTSAASHAETESHGGGD